jgi:starch synthase
MHVVTLAAENGALPHGKVGGVADVVRDLPLALTELGLTCSVLSPGYGVLANTAGATQRASLRVPFGGSTTSVDVFEVFRDDGSVQHILFEHPGFSPQGPGKIYCDDGAGAPFATDASKFALFSAAAASFVLQMDQAPDVVHLHDWHAAFYAVLREFDAHYCDLRKIRTVFTVHNLAMQGIRPLRGHASSLETWYPGLRYKLSGVVDPRYPDCINPMAAAIRLADCINTVSATYAGEILRANDAPRGFYGGEGLEADLRKVHAARRLHGILNGTEYPERRKRRPGWRHMIDTIRPEVAAWQRRGGARQSIHKLALQRLDGLPKRRPAYVLTSIGRLTAQKATLFLQSGDTGVSSLEEILGLMGKRGIFILVGSGDIELEKRMAAIAAANQNFVFLCGYSELCADLLYRGGDLFLMPSSFEPCGISQMLAMRESQPCVVHAVGGLRDTVRNRVDGFAFTGDSPEVQSQAFVETVRGALTTKTDAPEDWQQLRAAAAAARFSWANSARQYARIMYDYSAF